MAADENKDINISGGQVLISSKTDEENAINLTTNVGTTETIVINNIQGINESAIKIEATMGGIDIDADENKDINISGGQILVSSKIGLYGFQSIRGATQLVLCNRHLSVESSLPYASTR